MSRRTSPAAVRSIASSIPSSVNLDGFIDTASKVVDKVAACAGSKLDAQHLELIERWLAAHFYAAINPSSSGGNISSKSIGSASKSFNVAPVGMNFEATPFGQHAMMIDTSGCLKQLTGEPIKLFWAGDNEDDYDISPESDGGWAL